MSKFHINSQGEPGKCSAEKGGCPFGSESEHHASPEAARSAYEEKNVGGLMPTMKRKKTEGSFAPNLTRDDFEGLKQENLFLNNKSYEDVVFDEQELRERFSDEADVDSKINEYRKEWMERDRVHPAESGETVPARLVPVGSKVLIADPETGAKKRVTISKVDQLKQPDGTWKSMAKYRYKGEDHFVDADTKLEVETASEKPLAKAWEIENRKAESLLYARREAHNMNPDEVRKDKATRKAMTGEGGVRDISAEEDYLNRNNSGSRMKHPGFVEGPRIPTQWNPIKKGEKLWLVSGTSGNAERVIGNTEDEAKAAFAKARGLNESNLKAKKC